MYAAVRRYEGINDDDEAARLVRDSFMPQLEKVQGFIAYYWIDAGEGIMASLSVFEDKAGADESVKFAHKWIEETAPNLGTRRRSPRATLSRPTRSRRPYATTLAADARLFF